MLKFEVLKIYVYINYTYRYVPFKNLSKNIDLFYIKKSCKARIRMEYGVRTVLFLYYDKYTQCYNFKYFFLNFIHFK